MFGMGSPMVDVRAVLAQKERQLERVRNEVGALLHVIPLLEEEEPAPAVPAAHKKRVTDSGDSPHRGIAELELYSVRKA